MNITQIKIYFKNCRKRFQRHLLLAKYTKTYLVEYDYVRGLIIPLGNRILSERKPNFTINFILFSVY